MKILIIRPLPAAKHTAEIALADNISAEIAPLFDLSPVTWVPPDPYAFDGLLLTSGNALRHGGDKIDKMRDLPVLAVGQATAQAAAQRGFRLALVGNRDKADLLQKAETKGFKRLLWLAGKHRTAATPNEALIAERITIYESAEQKAPENFNAMVARCDAVMLHSPRAAAHFLTELRRCSLEHGQISIAALSNAVAEAAGNGWKNIVIAQEPNDKALLRAAKSITT